MKSMSVRMGHLVAAAVLALPLGRAVWAQNGGKYIEGATMISENPDPVEGSKYLDRVQRSEKDLYQLAPPAGSRLVRRGDVDLISFIVDAKSWGGSLQRLNLNGRAAVPAATAPAMMKATDQLQAQDPVSMAELVSNIKKELPRTFKAVQVLQERQVKNYPGGKVAVRLDFSMEAALGAATGGLVTDMKGRGASGSAQPARGVAPAADINIGIYRQQLIVQTQTDKDGKGTQYYFLTLYAPLKDKEDATKTFEAMLGSFELLDAKALYENRKTASATGKSWLAKRSAEEFAQKMNNQPRFFLRQMDSKNVGFIALEEATKETGRDGRLVDIERAGRKGVAMNVKFATFGEKGVDYGQIEEFWANSKDARGQELGPYTEWNVITKSQIKDPLPVGQVGRDGLPYRQLTLWLQETGNIAQDSPNQRPRILVTYGGDKQQKLPTGIDAVAPEGNTAAPLPKVLDYTWTRFVDLTKPQEMTFTTTITTPAKGVVTLRTLVVTGKTEAIKVNGKSVAAYRCNDQVDQDFTTLWVDRDGQILLMKNSGQVVFEPTTLDTINKLWPNRPTQ